MALMGSWQTDNELTIQQFIKGMRLMRLANKERWYVVNCKVNGKQVEVKAFKTWLQIFRVDGVNCSNAMEESVTAMNKHIKEALK